MTNLLWLNAGTPHTNLSYWTGSVGRVTITEYQVHMHMYVYQACICVSLFSLSNSLVPGIMNRHAMVRLSGVFVKPRPLSSMLVDWFMHTFSGVAESISTQVSLTTWTCENISYHNWHAIILVHTWSMIVCRSVKLVKNTLLFTPPATVLSWL